MTQSHEGLHRNSSTTAMTNTHQGYPSSTYPAITRTRQIIYRAYKTELKLNNHQRTHCRKHAGCARFAYNWGLQRKIDEYKKTGKSSSAYDLHRELNRLKKTKFSWMYKVSKCAPQEALRNLENAFNHFFRRIRKGEKPGFPKFKSRKWGIGSFKLTDKIHVFKDYIQLPRLGRLRLKESGYLPSEGGNVHILSATVSEKADRWFVSLQVQEEIEILENKEPVAGADVGVHTLATISDGSVFKNPKALHRFERKLKRMHRSLSRKQRGSRNREKVKANLQTLYARIVNIRKDAIHKVTTLLAKTKSVVVIEHLNVRGMQRNGHLAKSISDVGFFEFRRQLEYKTIWYGSKLCVVPLFFPSSKKCSRCGYVKGKLLLSTRIYQCEQCGLKLDRDLNASYNLKLIAVSSTEMRNACREAGGNSLRAVPVNDPGTEQRII
jgi:putative transposase